MHTRRYAIFVSGLSQSGVGNSRKCCFLGVLSISQFSDCHTLHNPVWHVAQETCFIHFLSDVSYMIVQCVSHHSVTMLDSFPCDTSLRIVPVYRIRCLTANHRRHSTSTMRRFTIGVNDLKGCPQLAYGWSRSLSLADFATTTGRDGHERPRS